MAEDEALLQVKCTPKAAHNKIGAWRKDAQGRAVLQVHVTAAPENGKANDAVIALLASHFDIPASHIELVRGATGRVKLFRLPPGTPLPL